MPTVSSFHVIDGLYTLLFTSYCMWSLLFGYWGKPPHTGETALCTCVYLFAAIYRKLKMSSYIYKYFEVSQIVYSLVIIHFDIILTNHCWEGQIH